jgi:hypothetical protein
MWFAALSREMRKNGTPFLLRQTESDWIKRFFCPMSIPDLPVRLWPESRPLVELDDFIPGKAIEHFREMGIGGARKQQTRENDEVYLFVIPGSENRETMSESERNASMVEFFTCDEMLRKSGLFIDGEALQNADPAVSERKSDRH